MKFKPLPVSELKLKLMRGEDLSQIYEIYKHYGKEKLFFSDLSKIKDFGPTYPVVRLKSEMDPNIDFSIPLRYLEEKRLDVISKMFKLYMRSCDKAFLDIKQASHFVLRKESVNY